MPEREQPREAEEEVVGERDPGEEETEREQLKGAGAVERSVEEHGDVERQLRHEGEQDEHGDRHADPERRPQCATFGARPPGRTSSTAARSMTTARSPVPLEA